MKVRFVLLVVLLLAITVQSCGGEDIDYESIARSFEEAINAGDANAAASLFAEEGIFRRPYDFTIGLNTPVMICQGKEEIRECFQLIIDSGIQFRFSNYSERGHILCFIFGDSLDGVDWETEKANLMFEGEEITFFGPGC
jgi:hypothetical protein